MAIQSCPRCGSDRVRRGYRQTPWWSAAIGRYHLLCNSCNWEFVGFAVPGTVPANSRKRKKQPPENSFEQTSNKSEKVDEIVVLGETISSNEIEKKAFDETAEKSVSDEVKSFALSESLENDRDLETSVHEINVDNGRNENLKRKDKAKRVKKKNRTRAKIRK